MGYGSCFFIRDPHDQTRLLQLKQGLPHRGLTHLEVARKLHFPERLTRLEFPPAHSLSETRRDGLHQSVPPNGEGAFHGVGGKAASDFQGHTGKTRITENAQVTAQASLVNATTTDLGVVVDRSKMDVLLLNGRNFQQLVGLQAGVINSPSSGAGGRRD